MTLDEAEEEVLQQEEHTAADLVSETAAELSSQQLGDNRVLTPIGGSPDISPTSTPVKTPVSSLDDRQGEFYKHLLNKTLDVTECYYGVCEQQIFCQIFVTVNLLRYLK